MGHNYCTSPEAKQEKFISWYITSISASDTSTTLRHYLVVICFPTADQLNIFINHEQKRWGNWIFISTAIILIHSYVHKNKTIQVSIQNCIMWVTQKQEGNYAMKKKGQIISSTVGPLYSRVPPPQVSYSWIQQTADPKYLGKKLQNVPKSKIWFFHELAFIYVALTLYLQLFT